MDAHSALNSLWLTYMSSLLGSMCGSRSTNANANCPPNTPRLVFRMLRNVSGSGTKASNILVSDRLSDLIAW